MKGRRGEEGGNRGNVGGEGKEGGRKKNKPGSLVVQPGAPLPTFPSWAGTDCQREGGKRREGGREKRWREEG